MVVSGYGMQHQQQCHGEVIQTSGAAIVPVGVLEPLMDSDRPVTLFVQHIILRIEM